MKLRITLLFTVFITAISIAQQKDDRIEKLSNEIDTSDITRHLYVLTSDSLAGRESGTMAFAKTINYLQSTYEKNLFGSDSVFLQDYSALRKKKKDTLNKEMVNSANVLAYIAGTDLKNEIIVISAHADHLGVHDEKIFKGADDDASGTVALLELAQAFAIAKKNKKGPRRSILFISFSGEEKGLLGSAHYTENPIYPIENTMCNLNVDMIGRVDEAHKDSANYIYIIGSNMLSTRLHNINQWCADAYSDLHLDYRYNSTEDANRYYYRSDHYNFAKKNIPVVFYFNGTHPDYHEATDTPEKINIPLLQKRIQYIFSVAYTLATIDEKIVNDLK
jgi:Zn-dependent M28 family amino/carboxypeptidase